MATGSLANVVYQTPYNFRGLITIGKVIIVIDLIMFVFFTALIMRRFIVAHSSLGIHSSVPAKPSLWEHSGSRSDLFSKVCFWVTCSFTLLFAIFQYDLLFVTQRINIQGMTPAWILPMYPLIVTGRLAGVILQHQQPPAGVPVFVAGVTFQGLGWLVTALLYAIWVIRLFSAELPVPSLRPGMYVAVGPAAYPAAGLVILSERATSVLPVDFLGVQTVSAPEILRATGSIAGIFLWLLAF
ncbi:uncharacterized protein A1O5_05336 [Cladophialophora psammophila CBS 110553]|uniref:C4-dicarboxylate transporter/malic acid transport protein n=1 Tax=Cladophialophora psammophila CBS 110553 TaxID=1182543 RepID=W9WUA3_9EURO|nr:uncharacterized protein A1O5_05336 [Cladophialophora psammophila CBS 110553]EXJ71528.1 hypothetical protein A1O5_05336 [Cladophialophora psammophila CBS 110553]